MVNSCYCFFLLTACPHRQGNNVTLTPATWITSPNSTTLHFNQLFMSPCLGVRCDVTRSFVLPGSFMRTFSISLTCHTARLVRSVLCSGLGGARGARTMPPRVHPGWKVRTLRTECSGLLEKTCLLCSACLSLGQGLWRGGGGEDENI